MHHRLKLIDGLTKITKVHKITVCSNETDLQLMYLPFGGGKRACAGQKFAEMELRIMLAKMLQSFTFSAYKEPKSEQILTWVIREMELSYKPRELPIANSL